MINLLNQITKQQKYKQPLFLSLLTKSNRQVNNPLILITLHEVVNEIRIKTSLRHSRNK
jgi:hypothetical protein